MHDGIKKSADIGDIKRLKYTFVDSLDVDPTFEEYLDDYNYCADKELFERHKDLTPFSDRKADWNDDYWQKIKRDLLKNFSRERLDHMRKVALVVLADKVERLKRERQQNRQPFPPSISQPPAAVRPASQPFLPFKSEAEQQREIEAAKRQLAQKNAEVERQQKLQQQELDRQRQENLKRKKEETPPPKKSSGIAPLIIIAAVIAVIILILLK